jgi:hypothetical protein
MDGKKDRLIHDNPCAFAPRRNALACKQPVYK